MHVCITNVWARILSCPARRQHPSLLTPALNAHGVINAQATLQRECKRRRCTVLTIAHRMNTIVNNDLVLLMDDGKVSPVCNRIKYVVIETLFASACHLPYHICIVSATDVTQVGEFGSMHELVRDPSSRVHQLARTQGVVISSE